VLDRRHTEGEVTTEKIEKHRELLKTLDCLKSFRIRRDKFHAHFDKEFFFDRKRLTDEAPITWGDLERAVEVLSEVVNEYSSAYDAKYFEMTSSNINDLDDILDTLRKYQKHLEGNM
jgi:AbiU2